MFSDEISIAVSNTKEYIYYRPSKRIDLKIKPGDEVKEGTIAYKAITSKQKASEFINRSFIPLMKAIRSLHHRRSVLHPADEGHSTVASPPFSPSSHFINGLLTQTPQKLRQHSLSQ